MDKRCFAIGPDVFVPVIGPLIARLLVERWARTIPDLFPGAVEQGLTAHTVAWFTPFKVAIFTALLSGRAGV
ncbi:MAG: hypothetical protein GTN81_07265 [Proteobacteria bacterium]|nr:hypothetical protein [Pseudomonadota bacterium]